MKKTQGQEANHSGRSLERDVENEFAARDVPVLWHSISRNNLDMFAERQLIKRVPQRNWFSGYSHSEFVYHGPAGLAVRIECKWQEHAGSVDEKAPAMKENALLAPEPVVWLILGGPGMRIGIRRYLHKQCVDYALSGEKLIRFLMPEDVRRAIKQLVEQDDPGSPLLDAPYQPPYRRLGRRRPSGITFPAGSLL